MSTADVRDLDREDYLYRETRPATNTMASRYPAVITKMINKMSSLSPDDFLTQFRSAVFHGGEPVDVTKKKPPAWETSDHLRHNPTSAEPLIDADAASKYLGYKPITMLRMAKQGQLPSVALPIGKSGKFRYRFKVSELEAYVESLSRPGNAS
jgi:Helix-turn-helix domain